MTLLRTPTTFPSSSYLRRQSLEVASLLSGFVFCLACDLNTQAPHTGPGPDTGQSTLQDAATNDAAAATNDATGEDGGAFPDLADDGSPPFSPALRVYLLAGQSNMLGSNSTLPRLTSYACHADASLGEHCGDSSIADGELTPSFLEAAKAGYGAAPPNAAPTLQLGNFLCAAGAIDGDDSCGNRRFGIVDRLFRSISDNYYHSDNDAYQWGYDGYKQMSVALDLAAMVDEGMLTADLLRERDDASVIMYLGKLGNDGSRGYSMTLGPLAPGFGAGRANVYGPELALGHYLADAERNPIVFVKVVQGGTSLRVDWRSPSVAANSGNEYTDEELKRTSLYPQLVEAAQSATKSAEFAAGFPEYAELPVELAGFVWFQGWNDGDTLSASQYLTNFRGFVGDLRKDLAAPDLPIVVAVSHRGDEDGPLQVAQRTVADETPNMAYCTTDDLSNYFHYDSAAYLAIGRRMAQTMLDL